MEKTVIIGLELTVFVLVAVWVLWRYDRRLEKAKRENMVLEDVIQGYIEANANPKAFYVAGRINEGFHYLSPAPWGVYRVVCKNGEVYKALIRTFDDEDEEFNQREAEELRDILNEK